MPSLLEITGDDIAQLGDSDLRSLVGQLCEAEFRRANLPVSGIALAKTIQANETLSLRDETLFERLFLQRNGPDNALFKSAMAISLLYSFDGEDVLSKESELSLLGSIIGKSGDALYTDVSEIIRRDLIQSRGKWRAVLPHAVANYLARRALDSFPKEKIVQTILSSGSERVIKSFSRRLSYLHDTPKAQEIAKEWLKQDGFIGSHIGDLNDFDISVLRNIASVLPQTALEAIERAANASNGAQFTSRENKHFSDYVGLLRHIAFEDSLFTRSANLICRFALTEKPTENSNSIRDTLKSMFFIYLSGNHASLETRTSFIERLIFDNASQDGQNLGLSLLDAALKTGHFSSHYDYQFGARLRDYG